MIKRIKGIIGLLLIILFSNVYAGDETVRRYTINGYIKDAENGEILIGSTVYVPEINMGTVSNVYGFYSLSIPSGEYIIEFSYIGYQKERLTLLVNEDLRYNVELVPDSREIEAVIVTAEKENAHVTRLEMSTAKLDIKTIRQLPALMGEVDILKAIQLLPGVLATSEGSSNFSVRGGSFDQNLILLDEATVYNASHLMGFFSVFNNDAIKDVKLYKGDIPASYGGRLSSLLDVRMKDGNSKKFSGTGGIGTISSRLTLEGPILKDRSSFIVSGRRTYMDIFAPLALDEELRDNRLYFYDLNMKVNHTLNDNNRFFISGYFGRDVFKNDFASMEFGNATFTARWNHLFSRRLFSNISLIYNNYDYRLGWAPTESTSFIWDYDMQDLAFRADFNFFPDPRNTIRFGVHSIYHILNPGVVSSDGVYPTYTLPLNFALQHAIFASNEQSISSRLSLKYGIRYSLFQNIGEGTVYNIDDDFQASDSVVYDKGEIFNGYGGFEPRLGLVYELSNLSSIRASYSRTRQYFQLASNSTAGTPLDLWFTASPNVKPQIADQVAIGYFRNIFNNRVETSVEVYYKKMQNTIDFKDHAYLYLNRILETELRFGESSAYGAEFLVQIPTGRVNGWVSYTYSRVEREIGEINNGEPFSAPFEKPHSLNIVANVEISKRLSAGAVWVYATGTPATFPVGRAEIGNVIYPIYSERNAYRLPNYHRLDVSLTLRGKERPSRAWQGEWNFSVYNAYARKNAWAIQFVQDQENPNETYAQKVFLFSIVPSITYNFKF